MFCVALEIVQTILDTTYAKPTPATTGKRLTIFITPIFCLSRTAVMKIVNNGVAARTT